MPTSTGVRIFLGLPKHLLVPTLSRLSCEGFWRRPRSHNSLLFGRGETLWVQRTLRGELLEEDVSLWLASNEGLENSDWGSTEYALEAWLRKGVLEQVDCVPGIVEEDLSFVLALVPSVLDDNIWWEKCAFEVFVLAFNVLVF